MTRDEIMAMSKEQLRVEIGKRKGYAWYESTDCAYFTKETAILPEGLVEVETPSAPRRHVLLPCPDYPHDIAAAWELVEEMRNAGSKPGMFGGERWASVKVETSDWRWFENPGIHPNYRCIFRIKNKRCWFAEGDTAPLAICRAWLIWSEESGNGQ